MSQHSVRKWRENIEDDGHTDEDLPRGDVELIDLIDEPTDNQIVGQCERDRRGDGIVCADVSNDGDFRGDLDVRTQEFAKERRDGSTSPPIFDWMEYKLVATVGIFLPAGKFIVYSKRDTFFEAPVVIRCKPVGPQLARPLEST